MRQDLAIIWCLLKMLYHYFLFPARDGKLNISSLCLSSKLSQSKCFCFFFDRLMMALSKGPLYRLRAVLSIYPAGNFKTTNPFLGDKKQFINPLTAKGSSTKHFIVYLLLNILFVIDKKNTIKSNHFQYLAICSTFFLLLFYICFISKNIGRRRWRW